MSAPVPEEAIDTRTQRLRSLAHSGPGTDLGRLLRTFWQPVALAERLAPGKKQLARILGEDLTLYRGASGQPHIVGRRCAHRGTFLHTGWVEGDEIRCMYHGWKYDGSGRCTERPAELDDGQGRVRIAGYPAYEYAGVIFGYFGPDPAPAFELPRKDVCEGPDHFVLARMQHWPCNWFQAVENAMDGVHVSFVHQKGRVGPFGQSISTAIPELEYMETESGIRQIATRGPGNVRVSDWTFPNSNHIRVPGPTLDDPWIDTISFKVPVDDQSHLRFSVYAVPRVDPETDRRLQEHLREHGSYDASQHHHELLVEERYPEESLAQLTPAQDYVAQVGQGTIADREHEILGRSDAGIALMRRIFLREMDAVREGGSPKAWRRLDKAAELPIPVS